MNILFGVQGTGNGHLSRARAMASCLSQYPELDITWLFSGRPRENYFDMNDFGDFECRQGLTFFSRNGRIQILQTIFRNRPFKFIKDVKQLDLSCFDLIISDYEPVTAWALRNSGKPGLGIGHQYAFNHRVPVKGNDPVSHAIMKLFAPMSRSLGLHWFHFDQPILPPIIDVAHCTAGRVVPNKVLVYLPFENTAELLPLFKKFSAFEFYVYAPQVTDNDDDNCHTRSFSRSGFKADLAEAGWVLCNSGFELISEALQLGKRIMSKPLKGQMEQLSNAAALEQLGLATVEASIDQRCLDFWFSCEPDPVSIRYPDVAAAIAAWIHGGCRQPIPELSAELWRQTQGFEERTTQTGISSPRFIL